MVPTRVIRRRELDAGGTAVRRPRLRGTASGTRGVAALGLEGARAPPSLPRATRCRRTTCRIFDSAPPAVIEQLCGATASWIAVAREAAEQAISPG